MNYYDFESCKWELKLKHESGVTVGFFVSFGIQKDGQMLLYPTFAKKQFAFCPHRYLKDFNTRSNSGDTFSELPDYISLFDKEDVENLRLVSF